MISVQYTVLYLGGGAFFETQCIFRTAKVKVHRRRITTKLRVFAPFLKIKIY